MMFSDSIIEKLRGKTKIRIMMVLVLGSGHFRGGKMWRRAALVKDMQLTCSTLAGP